MLIGVKINFELLMKNNAEIIEVIYGLNNNISYNIKEFFEKNSDDIKNEIIVFVSKIKKEKINSTSVKELLSFDKNFSLWDLSLINEKNVYKSDCFLNLTKFITINKILKKKKCKKLILKNFDKKFIDIFKKSSLNDLYDFETCNEINYNKNLRDKILDIVNRSVILSFFYFIFYSFRNFGFKNINEIGNNYKYIIINYFTQYDQKKLDQSKFEPNQWPKYLNKKNNLFWLNIFLPSKRFRTIHKANNFLKNKNIHNIDFINNYFNLKIFFNVIKVFLNSNYKFNRYIKNYSFAKSKKDYYLFLNQEIKKSLCCFHLLQNLSYHFLIKDIFKKSINKNNKLLYLFENQPWERSLNYISSKNKIEEVYGYSHTTINYWHLNYFHTKSENQNFKQNYLPKKILCHSKSCRKHLNSQGITSEKILNVSAERFKWALKIKKNQISKSKTLKILIIGDYENKINNNLIDIINNSIEKLSDNKKLIFFYKPHPSTFQDHRNLNSKIEIIRDNLKKIINNFNLIISTNSTAASAELSITNKKILIFIDKTNLDLSPYKIKNKFLLDVNFTDEFELIKKLKSLKNINNIKYNFYFQKKYFNKWKKLFK